MNAARWLFSLDALQFSLVFTAAAFLVSVPFWAAKKSNNQAQNAPKDREK